MLPIKTVFQRNSLCQASGLHRLGAGADSWHSSTSRQRLQGSLLRLQFAIKKPIKLCVLYFLFTKLYELLAFGKNALLLLFFILLHERTPLLQLSFSLGLLRESISISNIVKCVHNLTSVPGVVRCPCGGHEALVAKSFICWLAMAIDNLFFLKIGGPI